MQFKNATNDWSKRYVLFLFFCFLFSTKSSDLPAIVKAEFLSSMQLNKAWYATEQGMLCQFL